jgi:hypothetical protein
MVQLPLYRLCLGIINLGDAVPAVKVAVTMAGASLKYVKIIYQILHIFQQYIKKLVS